MPSSDAAAITLTSARKGDRVTRLLSFLRKWLEIAGLLLDPTFYPSGNAVEGETR
ncbi:MAG: hypothetical protein NUW01_16165 [Gemmatimonadaceae bacterium]|nr:hypothetical protein [Gemmatimonadaceae bacterium]